MKERRTEHQDERDHRYEDDQRTPHDRRRDGVPPTGPGGVRLKDRDTAASEVAADDREERGQEREPVKDRARDDDRSRNAHRRQERSLEKEHPGQTDRSGQPREG